MPGKTWSRQEVLVALNLFCRTPFGRLHARNPEIIRVASLLGRSPNALAMKCCNLASLDPVLAERGIKGLRKASAVDRRVWSEFASDPEETGFQSELAVVELEGAAPRMVDTMDWEDIEGLDRETATKTRVNQHLFRAIVLSGYRESCAVCGMPIAALLSASHIIGWAEAPEFRMNPRNGVCLCSLHHRAFDKGLLLVHPDYRMAVAREVRRLAGNQAVDAYLTRYEGRTISLPDRWHPDPALLKRKLQSAGSAN